ncbi:hypothetical protein BGZ65_011777 [Modicella reniformis]|uniref:Uncharacterized protein n=1 Tax=Modicella reniformis TaxID=1440133 RepID=A0A9P6IQB8_9FUNG|nr:hypothetical protein BGZ65_011777 [Modicella reniformis]
MFHLKIDKKDIDTFWQLCTHLAHLERLEIIKSSTPQQDNLSMKFPSIKELRMSSTNGFHIHIHILDLIQRCPNLTSFKYFGGEERLDHMTEDAILRIIGGMQRINVFEIYRPLDSFGSNAIELLRPHFSNIRVHLRHLEDRETSAMAQEILTSCPLLELLTAPPIEASVVTEGKHETSGVVVSSRL